ncbi:hypothetical protein H7H82_02985 [Mycobacterium heidelbergense]|uniref:hypothetical protein n=1 Tax=Mycobacterium heidelbergense TaxID=53376 RepID=UPI00115147B7|nr:hypothetical protein [Mycobacterium heidelbergense]MCV7049579.1 hypothetical protein [Mycobacterium heidelbergense]BBZ52710.1 hypothetical protein MHEI_44270 [Mycobacterium heidelbergense]
MTIQHGAALAKNTTTDHSAQLNELKQIKIALGIIVVTLGLALMFVGIYGASGGCSHPRQPTPNQVVPSNPLEPWRG